MSVQHSMQSPSQLGAGRRRSNGAGSSGGGAHKKGHVNGNAPPPPSYESAAHVVLPPPYLGGPPPVPLAGVLMMGPLPPPPLMAPMAPHPGRDNQVSMAPPPPPPPPLTGVIWGTALLPPPPLPPQLPPPAYHDPSNALAPPPEYPGVSNSPQSSKKVIRRGKVTAHTADVYPDHRADPRQAPHADGTKATSKADDAHTGRNHNGHARPAASEDATRAPLTHSEPLAATAVPPRSPSDTSTVSKHAQTRPHAASERPSTDAATTTSAPALTTAPSGTHVPPLGVFQAAGGPLSYNGTAAVVSIADENGNSHRSISNGLLAGSVPSLDMSASGSFHRGPNTESPFPAGHPLAAGSGIPTPSSQVRRSGEFAIGPHGAAVGGPMRAVSPICASVRGKKTMTHMPYGPAPLDKTHNGLTESWLSDVRDADEQGRAHAGSATAPSPLHSSLRGGTYNLSQSQHAFFGAHTATTAPTPQVISRASPVTAAPLSSPPASPPRASVHRPYQNADTYAAADDGSNTHSVHVIERRGTHLTSPVSQGPKLLAQSSPLAVSFPSQYGQSYPPSAQLSSQPSLVCMGSQTQPQPSPTVTQARYSPDSDAPVSRHRMTNNPYVPVLPQASDALPAPTTAPTTVPGLTGAVPNPSTHPMRTLLGQGHRPPTGNGGGGGSQGRTRPSSIVTSNAPSSGAPSPHFAPGAAPLCSAVQQSPLPQQPFSAAQGQGPVYTQGTAPPHMHPQGSWTPAPGPLTALSWPVPSASRTVN